MGYPQMARIAGCMLSRLPAVVLVSLLVLSLFGCAPAPSPDVPIQEGMAELYLLNDSGWTLIPLHEDVIDNGNQIASLPRLRYVRIFITPGRHVLRPGPVTLGITLDAAPGGTYYVAVAYKSGAPWAFPYAGNPLVIKQVSAHEGRGLIEEMTPK